MDSSGLRIPAPGAGMPGSERAAVTETEAVAVMGLRGRDDAAVESKTSR